MTKPAYIFDKEVGNFHYGKGHPMKPHRISVTHSLVHSYKLDPYLDIIQPSISIDDENKIENICDEEVVDSNSNIKQAILGYHTKHYIDSLTHTSKIDDCPCFMGIDEYYTRYTFSTLTAVQLINKGLNRIAINWSGGLHHAKKEEASGFCYVNDIVIGIQELLKIHERVLYLDIDIHHGDGVEEAFYDNPRVMTLSLHKFGDNYFPGTGEIFSTGIDVGKGYAVNVPLKSGTDDNAYMYIFKPIVKACVNKFKPEVIVMQCGADSLAGDRIGCFNLSVHGHGECVRFVKKLGIKMLVLGGGGYNPKNVARAWAYETSILCGVEIDNEIPKDCVYYEYFKNSYKLHPTLNGKYDNLNSRKYLDTVKSIIFENLDKI